MNEEPAAEIRIVENEAEEYADFLQREGEELTVSVEGPSLSEEERAHAESEIQRAVVEEYRAIVEEITETAAEELTGADEGERAQGSRLGQALAHKNRWSHGEQPADVPIIGLPLPDEGIQRIRRLVRQVREGLGLGGTLPYECSLTRRRNKLHRNFTQAHRSWTISGFFHRDGPIGSKYASPLIDAPPSP